MMGCCHELSQEEIQAIFEAADAARKRRAETMPTIKHALHIMRDAFTRLEEMGFRDAIYCPKDGTPFECIEAGSSGIHICTYVGDWPTGHYYIIDECDLWPSHPILFRSIPKGATT